MLAWIAGAIMAPVFLLLLFIAVFGWNWLRAPIERLALDKSGRVLSIHGDLTVKFAWPLPHIRAEGVTFANPDWAHEKQMVTAEAVDIAIDLPQLLRRNIVFPEVRLVQPLVYLEQGSGGRKNWLLDLDQQDEGARIRIDRLMLDRGTLGYDHAAKRTRIRAELSTEATASGSTAVVAGLRFTAQGEYEGMPVKASGSGGPVLGLRDETTPYPLQLDLVVGGTGGTQVKAEGTITSLLKFTALDMRLALKGASLAQLFPLIGIAFPETRAYATEGRIVHSGQDWRYEKFSGRIGASDIAGTIDVDTAGVAGGAGKRPFLKADLTSRLLDLADLGPVIGSRPGSVKAAKQAASQVVGSAAVTPRAARVLPDMPFNTDHWDSVDADVTLKAGTIRRAKELPLENLVTHLTLRDSVLRLDPLEVGVAGGHLNAVISLDGRNNPIQAEVKVQARKLLLARLLPTVDLNKNSIGLINGDFQLTGHGNSVGRMLASSNGNVALVVAKGQISKLMMEKMGLHLWEMLELKLTGDRLINLRCAVADFSVKNGAMHADALILDTEVTTIVGTGRVDLANEMLDLTLNQKTKATSPVALRSPITIRGSFAAPTVEVDKGRMAVRALGALAMGVVSPFLLIIPLIDAGPGKDSDCGKLVRDARAAPEPNAKDKDRNKDRAGAGANGEKTGPRP